MINERTPCLSLTSNLKYNEFVYLSLLNGLIDLLLLKEIPKGYLVFPLKIDNKSDNNDDYTNSLYLRFEVKDKQGVLSLITNRLAKYKISVKRIIQTPDKKNKKATIVIITHKTTEINARNCLNIFKKNKSLFKFPTLIRLYN